jgi:hypothetical protein
MRFFDDPATPLCHGGTGKFVGPEPDVDHAVSLVTLPLVSVTRDVPPTHVTNGLAPGMSG